MIKLEAYAITDIGKVRSNNEDNFFINGKYKKSTQLNSFLFKDNKKRKSYLYAVCDGMGGESYGELASLIASKSLNEFLNKEFNKEINSYINLANNLICDEIKKNEGIRIGTTVAALYIKNDKAYFYNVGDSRIYLFRSNTLTQISKDHTQAQSMVDMGLIPAEEMNLHKGKHKLTQHLGIFEDELIIEPHIFEEFEIQPNDVFVLCSDGITDMLSDSEIHKIANCSLTAKKMAKKLISEAINKGGKDNATAIVIKAKKKKWFFI